MATKLEPHKAAIVDAIKAGESRRSLAKKYKVAKSTMTDFVRELDIDTEVGQDEALKEQIRVLRTRANRSRTADVQAELVLEQIRRAVQGAEPKYSPPSDPVAVRRPDQVEHPAHVQALLLSDLHGGEVVTLDGTDGINEYSWEIMVKRLESIHNSLLSFKNNRPFAVKELQIWMLGDMNSGSNHLELIATNEKNAADQSYQMGLLLGKFVEELVPHYPKIKVVGVSGNHPRVTVKPANKEVFNNFDWMSYKIAEVHLANYESVETSFPHSGFVVAEIAGLNILLFHGDGIRSTMPGVPWGGVVRRANQLKAQYLDRGVKLDGFALGHFHQANAVAGNIWMNGSVKGADEYSIKQFGYGEKPTQLLLTFHDQKKRLTDVSYINP